MAFFDNHNLRILRFPHPSPRGFTPFFFLPLLTFLKKEEVQISLEVMCHNHPNWQPIISEDFQMEWHKPFDFSTEITDSSMWKVNTPGLPTI